MARAPDNSWQYKVSFGLVMVVMALVGGYFYQSFLEVRAARPVEVAIERIKERPGPIKRKLGDVHANDTEPAD